MFTPAQRQHLAKVRHDLRTPLNHILGYAEMLLEDPAIAERVGADLEKIRRSGRRLLDLIQEYLDEEKMSATPPDAMKLLHDLRTPINHIIGYSELIQERSEEGNLVEAQQDLDRIHAAAKAWLALMERELIPLTTLVSSKNKTEEPQPSLAPPPPATTPAKPGQRAAPGKILVVDDDPGNRDLLRRRLQREGHEVLEASTGLGALDAMRMSLPDLVLLDIEMPDIDGYEVLASAKSDATLASAAMIMVSGFDRQEWIARCIEAGAEDYLIKPFDPVLLRARVSACLEKNRLRDQERRTHQALVASQARLASELAEAAAYARSLMPPPLHGSIETQWEFHPSAQLGGDAFGYHWIDETHFAFYLLDVSGHGIGAALLSVSAVNLLRSQSLPGVDPRSPAQVLTGLNKAFPMEAHNNQYFTAWYGVFHKPSRQLRYASAGHPPGFLLGPGTVLDLRTAAPPVGCFGEATFTEQSTSIPRGAQVVIYSDGAYELETHSGRTESLMDFRAWILTQLPPSSFTPAGCVARARNILAPRGFDDDLSVLALRFLDDDTV
ncbi:MAG: response regulator [Verrucomicrobia bacterium]|nr:response regulator [Verrucomicrobiota bacterium]